LHKVFSRYLGLVVLLLTLVVLLSLGTSGSAQAYDAHSPILILDNTSLISLGLPGEGTEENPFLIQNYEIDGAGGSAIAIYDTDLHVKIRNCLFSDSTWPSAIIYLENVHNVKIENNHFVDGYVGVGLVSSSSITIRNNTFQNHNTGIVLEDSDHNYLINNTCVLDIEMPSGRTGIRLVSSGNNSLEMNNCSGNNVGIDLLFSNFTTLFANVCDGNDGSGISIDSSINNTLTENVCRDNYIGGIALYSASSATTGNMIGNNICSGNAVMSEWGAGIFLSSSSTYSISNNTISNNDLHGNYYGVSLLSSPHNTICSNTVHGNSASGIYISISSDNIVSSNDIFENADSGIWMESSDDCMVESNTARNNFDGIYLDGCERNVLFSNDLMANTYGIFLYECSLNTISFNECNSSNGGDGIYLLLSHSNGLFNNYCNSGYSDGIFLEASNQNALLNNTCNGNGNNGIEVSDSGQCIIANNTCIGNAIGIWLRTESDWNVVDKNLCSENSQAGIYLTDSYDCLVSNNTCNDNAPNSMGSGIVIDDSINDLLQDNDCSGNFYGIRLISSSSNNVLSGNDLVSNSRGVEISSTSSGNQIEGNTIAAADYGIIIGGEQYLVISGTVINGTMVTGCGHGVYLSYADGTVVTNSTVSTSLTGLYAYYSNSIVIVGNDISGNGNNGIELSNSAGSTIANNTCIGNAQMGIRLDFFHDGVVTNNTCIEGGVGIYLSISNDNQVRNNTCSMNTANPDFNYGIWIESSFRNSIINNTCSGNGAVGIFFSNHDSGFLINNTVNGNGNTGVRAYRSDDNLMAGNECLGNVFGIYLYECYRNSIADNYCASPTLIYLETVGIFLDYSDSNDVHSNECNHNNVGMHISDSDLNNITDNDCDHNSYGLGIGIKMVASNENWISNNSCSHNSVGINGIYSDWNDMIGNNCSDNTQYGINFYGDSSDGNLICNNTCNNNGYGMWISCLKDSTIIDNIFNGNRKAGVHIEYRSSDNVLAKNILLDNGYQLEDDGYGMWSAGMGLAIDGSGEYNACERNLIANNTITGSRLYGVSLINAFYCRLYGNVLIENNGATSVHDPDHVQAYDDGGNFWNDTEFGNLWGDWTTPDANVDGIVDEAYLVVGGTNKDLMPLAVSVVIDAPTDGFATGESSVDISGTAVSYFGVDHLIWHNAATGASGDCTGADIWMATVPLVNGDNVITVTMVDLHGSEANATITVVLDVVPPSLEITYPAEGAYVSSNVTVTWTGSDADSGIAYCLVSIESVFSDNVTGSSCTINGLAEGTYTVLVSAYDAVGNYMDVTVTFTVDVTAPVVTIISPADDHLSTSDSVTVTWNGSDTGSGVDHYVVSWEEGFPVTLPPSALSHTFTGLSDGSHLLTVVIYDKVGLSHTDSVEVLVDTQIPSLTITSPVQGGFVNNADVTVTWSCSDAGTGIAYCVASIEDLASFNTTGTSCTFIDLADGTYTVLVSAYDQLGNYRDRTVTFTVDTEAPTLVIDSPSEGQMFNVNSVTVSWSTTDANPGTVQVRFDGEGWVMATGGELMKSALSDGEHIAYVKVTDAAGNSLEVMVNFMVDTIAPVVAFISPEEGSIINSSVGTLRWNTDAAASCIRVDGGEWTELGTNTSWEYSLEDGEHAIEVKVTDQAGNSATAMLNITVDTTAPTAEYSPIGNELELGLVILIEFSEPMNQTSVSVVGLIGGLEWEGNTVIFTPAALSYNRAYTVLVSGKDLAGNGLDINWTFVTRSVGNLTGVILDENGDPVANVTVTAGGEFTAVTDENGRFLFVNLSVGTYLFEVDAEGFQPFTFNSTVEQGITVDEGTVEMVPEETVGDEDDTGSSIWPYVSIAMAVLAVVGVAALVRLRKK